HHEDDDTKLRKGMDQYGHCGYDGIERAKIWLTDFNRDWFVRSIARQGRLLRLLKLGLQVLQHICRFLNGIAARGGKFQAARLFTQVALVTRKVASEICQASGKDGSHPKQQCKGNAYNAYNGR